MKNGMKKIITFMIAAAMLSASVYAEPEDNELAIEEPVAADTEGPIAVGTFVPNYGEAEDGVAAEDGGGRENLPELGDIEKYLAENGYPDYVSFIFNSGAAMNGYDPSSGEEYQPQMTYMWEVGVVNATAAQKAEIQALIDGQYPIENIITFVECRYTYSQREAMASDVRSMVEKLYPDAEILDVILVRNGEYISVELKEMSLEQLADLEKSMAAAYGDLILVSNGLTDDITGNDIGGEPEVGAPQPGWGAATEIANEAAPEGDIAVGSDADGVIPVTDDNDGPAPAIGGDVDSAPTVGEIAAVPAPAEQSDGNTVLWICIAAALVIALGTVAFIYRAKLIPVFATSHGDAAVKPLTKKQAEEAVKNSEVTPDDSVLQAIKEKIDK